MIHTVRHRGRVLSLFTSPSLGARCYLSCGKFKKRFGGDRSGSAAVGDKIVVGDREFERDHLTNVPRNILDHVGRNLHRQHNHPINLVSRRIQKYFHAHFRNQFRSPLFTVLDDLEPVVSVEQNFDSVLVPADHVSRSPSDTYFINQRHVLRTHTSAHQSQALRGGLDACLLVGDVYRRDCIDPAHYPVFHQMEALRLFTGDQLFGCVADQTGLSLFEPHQAAAAHTTETTKLLEADLKRTLTGLAEHLFGADVERRWVDVYFPFTHPSYELEVRLAGQSEWLEVLGCGVTRQEILEEAGVGYRVAWAFGLGLDRLAMLLYQIPDIRLLWSTDSGFLSQFEVEDCETPVTYRPVSVYPQCVKDVSFWLPEQGYKPSDFMDLVRTEGGSLVEQVKLIDSYVAPDTGRHSHCYRVVFRDMERTLTNREINKIHSRIGEVAELELGVELRRRQE